MLKCKWVKDILNLISNVNTALIAGTSIVALLVAGLQYTFDFFTLTVCVPVWVATVAPLIVMWLLFFVFRMYSQLKSKKLHTQLFKEGDKVCLKGYNTKYIVKQYHYFKFKKVKCTFKVDETIKHYWFDEHELEPYEYVTPIWASLILLVSSFNKVLCALIFFFFPN